MDVEAATSAREGGDASATGAPGGQADGQAVSPGELQAASEGGSPTGAGAGGGANSLCRYRCSANLITSPVSTHAILPVSH